MKRKNVYSIADATFGLPCPFCGSENIQVTNTVKIIDGIRRRRACLDCNMRWNTIERNDMSDIEKLKD